MQHVSWLRLNVHSATLLAVLMFGTSVLTRLMPARATEGVVHARRWPAFISAATFEVGLVCTLFALWQVANRLAHGHISGGLATGRWIWHIERVMHLPSEVDTQQLILGHPWLVQAMNYYYDTVHMTAMALFLVWLWLRHRDRYPFMRNIVVAFTGMSLLVQMMAVAPPRLIGGVGLIDTAQKYGQSVYAAFPANIADQYAAMPSIHVGWAVLISFAIVACSTSRWRWLALLHAAITNFVVVATANHYWLDGIAALGILGLAWLIAFGIERVRRPHRVAVLDPEPATEPVPQIQQGAFS